MQLEWVVNVNGMGLRGGGSNLFKAILVKYFFACL